MAEPTAEINKAWKVRCRNCGEPIVWDGQDRTGWTHGDRDAPPLKQWVGRRCAGKVTGATPDTDRLAAEAFNAGEQFGRHAAASDILARLAVVLRYVEDNSDSEVAP